MQFVTSQCTIWSKERGCSYEDDFEGIGTAGAVLFVVTIACILGNLITNISSYVIALLLLIIAGCSIYCIIKALWTSLAILAGMRLAAILIIFLLVWAVVKLETLGNHIKEFICY